ncbi:MAG: VOC family protein [Xanthobacteraceae bacterium]|nr:VOC family protein [Xanthobacteraceae bacterium]
MARGLDHIVHAVRDLGAAAALYRRLGFQVGSRNRHPRAWGTQNHIVQLPGTFIELLTVADTTEIAPHGPHFFSFGAFNRDFLSRGEGLAMLVLEGRGAADVAEFRRAGIGDFELYEFEREGERPDGTPIRVAFALAFASDPQSPDAGFFTCQHRYPESFWNPAFQQHPNTAAAIAGVVLVAENPSDHHIFLEAFTGEREAQATSAGIAIRTPRGRIQVMEPDAFRDHFGTEPPATRRGARLAALRFAVRDLETVERGFRAANLPSSGRMGNLIVGPDTAMGAALVFEQI